MKKKMVLVSLLAISVAAQKGNAQNTSYDANIVPVPGTGTGNTLFGRNALFNNSTGSYNSATGIGSMYQNTNANNNTAQGYQSLYGIAFNSGSNNVALGYQSIFNNNAGSDNTAVGYQSLYGDIGGHNGTENVAIGKQTMYLNSGGLRNTACGTMALYNGGDNNSAIGYRCLYNNTGVNNTAIGYEGLFNNTGGVDNIAIGHSAAYYNGTGAQNVAIGTRALYSDIVGSSNVAIGMEAGYSGGSSASNFDFNVFIGREAGYSYDASNAVVIGYQAGRAFTGNSSISSENTFVGYRSGYSATFGGNPGSNSFFGNQSGYGTSSGDYNVFMGTRSGYNNTTGSENTFLGYESGRNNLATFRNTYLGDHAGFNSGGNENTFNGYKSGENGIGNSNVAFGAYAMTSASSGDENTVVGYKANFNSPGTSYNTIVGSQAAYSNSSGSHNTYMGYKSGYSHLTGNENTYLGYMASLNHQTGNNNVSVGGNSGITLTSGANNTFLGGSADGGAAALSNAAAVGANAVVMGNDNMILGDNSVNVGIGLSGASSGPQNKLEINTAAGSPAPGASGLRFRDLTTASTANANPGPGVLSVDGNGDVIYVTVPGGGGSPLGNACGGASNPLTSDYEIPLNNLRFNFTTPAGTKPQVLIGYPNCISTTARLDVTDDNNGIGIQGYCSTSAHDNIGIYGKGYDPTGSSFALTTIGVIGEANLAARNKAAGVAGFCGPYAFGTMPAGQTIGVYGNSVANGGNWAGYFDGDVNFMGQVWGSQFSWTSDKRFKTNIAELKSATAKIMGLKGYTYEFKRDEFKNRNFPGGQQIGYLAQELQEVFPQLVNEDKQGYLAVNYVGMIPVLTQAIKEQQQQIDELKSLVSALTGNTAANKTQGSSTASTPVSLSDKNVVVLNQNVPNPFAESTVIAYNIPVDFGKAQIIFSTTDGQVIKVIDIREKGAGSLSVFANDLSHGAYTYTLVVDGKAMDTKKMIKD